MSRAHESADQTSAAVATRVATPQTPAEQPRIVDEHPFTDAYGDVGIEAVDSRGRRWYHLRPDPRGRADAFGVNYTWWIFTLLILLIVFLPWGWWY